MNNNNEDHEEEKVLWLHGSLVHYAPRWRTSGMGYAWQYHFGNGLVRRKWRQYGSTADVGIGVEDPFAKLDVRKEATEGLGIDFGIRSVVALEEGNKIAVGAFSQVTGLSNIGVVAIASEAENNVGIATVAATGGTGTAVIGGFFTADRGYDSGDAFAVWGRVENMSSVGVGWAGYFEGDGFLGNGPWSYSDAELKSDIEEIPGGTSLERIMALSPKSYVFNVAEHPGMGMPQGIQYGLLAQEVEEIYLALVKEVHRPAVIGADGQIQEEPIAFKAMKYEGLIADLIGAVRQQQTMIADLQEQVASCCTYGGDMRNMNAGSTVPGSLETDLRIIPNPVADQTELRYTVGTAGHVRLEITDGMGRVVLTQYEGARSAAAYVYQWNTTMLAAGTYHCTLFVDGEPLVKKAVKLSER